MLHQKYLEARKKALGEECPCTLDGIHNMTLALDGQGSYVEAGVLLPQCWETWKKTLGMSHPNTLNASNDHNKAVALLH
eukprot:13499550-Ditylum_brightwellii.AAC.1